MAVARVHVSAWQSGYRGLLPDEYLDALRPEDRAAAYTYADTRPASPHTLLAVDGGDVLGFATCAPSHDPDRPFHGELLGLYVNPDHWNSGVGRALLAAARDRLAQTHEDAILWALVGNERAHAFYRRDGWFQDGMRRIGGSWGARYEEIRFERTLP
jgi:GNAT superfamily N-acetyltransferase